MAELHTGTNGGCRWAWAESKLPTYRIGGRVNPICINKHNVGRIAERIVSNELEFRGFRVSDLNKEGTSANADLLAAKDEKTWQIQVKGATEENGWWVNYGYCDEAIIAGEKPMFNRRPSSFYRTEIVVLVSVKSPKEYSCVVLPIEIAERLAQLSLDRDFRIPKKWVAQEAGQGICLVGVRSEDEKCFEKRFARSRARTPCSLHG